MAPPIPPGWYHAEGDQEATVRYWDGESWVGGAVSLPNVGRAVERGWFARLWIPTGRVNRRTYALVVGASFVIGFSAGFLDLVVGTYDDESGWGVFTVGAMLLGWWPFIATTVKRFHDQDMSGWWLVVHFIPLVGFAMWVLNLFHGGSRGENRHGPSPPPSVAF